MFDCRVICVVSNCCIVDFRQISSSRCQQNDQAQRHELFQIVVVDNIAKHNDMNHSSVKSEAVAVDYMTEHYYLMFDCRVICVVSNCCIVDFCSILLHFMEKFKFHVGGNPSTWRKSNLKRYFSIMWQTAARTTAEVESTMSQTTKWSTPLSNLKQLLSTKWPSPICSILLHFMEKFKFHVGGNPSTWGKSTMFCKLITRSIT
jgi:hypothetical protein